MPTAERRRVLFIGEGVTLAHVGRPLRLAASLPATRYEVRLACDPRYRALVEASALPHEPLASVSGEAFMVALAAGRAVYDAGTLAAYVEADRELLRRFAPDLVVGDFRLSLSVSARLERIPYLAVSNAYWSPQAQPRYRVPELPITRVLGVRAAQWLFALARPIAFALHARPLNAVRRRYGLPVLGMDLRRVYTDADFLAYADVPELAPSLALPPRQRFLGPLLWSPPLPRPSWWGELAGAPQPLLYVTLGSSGRSALLAAVLEACAGLPVRVVAATAGHGAPADVPANARVTDYLPGTEAAALARVVVCNGGSPTTQQALAAGVPVLGIPSNLDQHLNMEILEAFGAALTLRAEHASVMRLRTALARLLDEPAFAAAAQRAAALYRPYRAEARFAAWVDEILPPPA